MTKAQWLLAIYLIGYMLIGCLPVSSQGDTAVTPIKANVVTKIGKAVVKETPVEVNDQIQAEMKIIKAMPAAIVLPTNYTVEVGDTLGKISKVYGVGVAHIAQVNNIVNVDYIYVGQELIIPDPTKIERDIYLEDKQIVIVLSLQKVFAYENGELVREFVVSTGLPNTPTVQGKYSVYLKYPSTRMSGPGYNLKNVPWTMYFHESYGIHGTYWHSNFGTPMSHGCVNMETSEAEWLYNWAPMGTSVWVQP